MAKVLHFMHTDYTLKKRVERACQEHDKDMIDRGAWMYQFEPNDSDDRPFQGKEDEE